MLTDPRGGLAAFTIAHHEPEFLPRWLDHHACQGAEALYVLRHQIPGLVRPRDYDPAALAVSEVPVVRRTAFDHTWLAGVVSGFASWLLWSYRAVLFAEADELVAPDPRAGFPDLRALLAARPGALYLRAQGFEVVHQPDAGEPAVDPAAPGPLLATRRAWYPSTLYSKCCLVRHVPGWREGFHELNLPEQPLADPDLLLVHIRKVDLATAVARGRRSAALPWNAADRADGRGRQNLLDTEPALRDHFARHADTGEEVGPFLREIPAEVRRAF